jgi:ubiquinone/menaquinone biosynthesis C-methylase UbiE
VELSRRQKKVQEHYNDTCSANRGCGSPLGKVQLLPGQTVLDLGCGAGLEAIEAARQVGKDGIVIGIDMSPEMLGLARENAEKAELQNIKFLEGVIEDIPLQDNAVDVIISNCVINLVDDKFAALKEANRVLKSNGRLAIADIIATCVSGIVPNIMLDNAAYILGCLSGVIFKEDYLEMLVEAGFKNPKIEIIKQYSFASFIIEAKEKMLDDLLDTLDEKLIDKAIASAYVMAG